MRSLTSVVLAAGILLFVALASVILVWDGLAAELSPARGDTRPRWKSRLRLAVGVLGFSLAVWLGLGMLTHAR